MQAEDDSREVVRAAAWVVREAGRYNMWTGDAWTAAMCVAAIWGRAEVVDWMNSLGRGWHRAYSECYLAAAPELLRAAELQARAMPHGADYRAALTRAAGAGMRPGGPTAQALGAFEDRHEIGWAAALATFAEEVCYDEGRDARDTLELEGTRGVFEPYLLKAVGAQLVARRPRATEIPHPAVPAGATGR